MGLVTYLVDRDRFPKVLLDSALYGTGPLAAQLDEGTRLGPSELTTRKTDAERQ